MDFITLKFMVIFCGVFLLYWILPSKFRTPYLLVVSYLLYMMWNPAFAIALSYVTIITYCGALLLSKLARRTVAKKKIVILFTIVSLLPLLLFKYSAFINENLLKLFSLIHLNFTNHSVEWAVPIGISFFTFQAVSYLLDVYHNRCSVEKNILTYALYVSFFPQITSGPISTAAELIPQFKLDRKFNYPQAVRGLRHILFGVFIKTVVADRAGIYVDMVFANIDKFSGINCFITSIVYSLQIYTDFLGYSLIAIGLAKMLGIDLINNFMRPYFAESVTDFWRRWHISLSRWLRNYVYIPLGGSRCSKFRNAVHIIITFLVSGIWHGANWTFIIWGIFHGVCQVIEKMFGLQNKSPKKIVKSLRILLTFLIINFAWIIFRSPDIHTAFLFMKQIFTGYKGLSIKTTGFDTLVYMVIGVAVLMAGEFIKEYRPAFFNKILQSQPLRFAIYLILAVSILAFGVVDGSGFIYVSF